MQKSYKGVKSDKCCEVVTVGRRAARGGKVEVTQLDPKWLQVLPIPFLSITEASPTFEG